MTWDAYNRRKDMLRGMLAVADTQREITLSELIDSTEGGREVFPADTDLLFELQMTWFQRLSGHMDRIAAEGEENPELVAVTAWVKTAAELPAVRALLDAHRDEPAMRKAFAKELAYLATSAGVPTYHLDLTGQGQRIQESARATLATTEPVEEQDTSRVGLIARLRNAIAA